MIKFSDEEFAEVEIREDFDIIKARARARVFAEELGFGIVDQTRIATAVSEIARNALVYGGGGKMTLSTIKGRKGLEIVIVDQGPGIPNVDRVLIESYPKRGVGLGLGLQGAKRLMDEFCIDSKPGVGTKVTMRKWLASGSRR
ncbi:MAG: anti-sigma regulatory factor [Aigarchaeota archaeon]|nr:anti-sigma regulatory factor [Aigarchaeota archaeon]MDH5704083.1 anti-sigma regulatory factor [Aigarchaeota archaeon]